MQIDRREFLKLAGYGGIVLVSGFSGLGRIAGAAMPSEDFLFVQLSDTHWGFSNPDVNPNFADTLKKAVEAVNALPVQPDFVMFTGDLTHVTDDGNERLKRLEGFRDIVSRLKTRTVRFMPGEHDAGLDEGKAFRKFFDKTHYVFDHKGIHFIVLDNVSDPRSMIGDEQLRWLSDDLKKLDRNARIVVFTHRPLFDLYPDWEWYTRDGAKAVELLMPYTNVIVFYGHIHQEHHHMTGHIAHHAAQGMMYRLPAPGSVPKKMPIPWDAAMPYKGLGFRGIRTNIKQPAYGITEYSVKGEKL